MQKEVIFLKNHFKLDYQLGIDFHSNNYAAKERINYEKGLKKELLDPSFSLEYLIGAAVIAAGYLIYIPFFYFDVNFPGSDKIYVFLQIFFECVPNDFSEEKLEWNQRRLFFKEKFHTIWTVKEGQIQMEDISFNRFFFVLKNSTPAATILNDFNKE